jgi:hypothetical protein
MDEVHKCTHDFGDNNISPSLTTYCTNLLLSFLSKRVLYSQNFSFILIGDFKEGKGYF